MTPVPPIPKEALEFFEAKQLEPGFSFEDVWAEEHLRAFTAAKFMREDVLAALREEVNRAIAEGQTFERWQREIADRLIEAGWWGEQDVIDPQTDEALTVDVPSRLNLIFEVNMRTARAAGQWQRIERRMDSHPYLLYQVGPSLNHREQHLAWHGLLLRADDVWWQSHYPPNGWRCKCHVRQVSSREAAKLEADGVRAPEPEPVLDDDGNPTGHRMERRVAVRREAPPIETREYVNRRTGRVDNVPVGIDPGFHRPPSSLVRLDGA